MQHIEKELSIDEAIAILVALKTPKMPPSPHLDFPRPIIKAMAGFSSEGDKAKEGTIKLVVRGDEDGISGTIEYSQKCNSLS